MTLLARVITGALFVREQQALALELAQIVRRGKTVPPQSDLRMLRQQMQARGDLYNALSLRVGFIGALVASMLAYLQQERQQRRARKVAAPQEA